MKKKDHFLAKTWEKSDAFMAQGKGEFILSKNKINNLIGRSISVGPFYYYVLNFCNFPDVTIEGKNESLIDFFGSDGSKMSLDLLISKMHPGDLPFIQKCEELVHQAITEVYADSLMDWKSSYCFRIKDKTGKYKLILHQSIPIETDENGALTYFINIHTNIEHITTINSRKMSFFGFNGMPSFIGVDPYEDHNFKTGENIFTARETEILRFIASGLTSKKISEKLFISEHTVKTHKQNILSKTTCKNFTELIVKSLNEGLM
jgi:DNA-binding CsgD family transcriptional regulator